MERQHPDKRDERPHDSGNRYGVEEFAREARITRVQAEILMKRHGARINELRALAYSLSRN